MIRFDLDFKHYESVTELKNDILEVLKKIKEGGLPKKDFELSSNDINNTLTWKLGKGTSVTFSDELEAWMGAEEETLVNRGTKKQNFELKPNFDYNYCQFFLTSDIVSPNQCLKDKLLPILAPPFQLYHEEGQPIFRSFESPIYQKIKPNWVEKIEVEFRDELGRILTMNKGMAYVLLHIKRKDSIGN